MRQGVVAVHIKIKAHMKFRIVFFSCTIIDPTFIYLFIRRKKLRSLGTFQKEMFFFGNWGKFCRKIISLTFFSKG
jgi:hypothetical protein